ncbi:MAG: hypothetical protein K2W96_18580 [Gemmataceae bacterium]|nr:hypothetical protein [Gemmataceae bacterium]
MHAQTWIALFRHIPPEKQPLFSIITANGTELTVQAFLRIEPELLIVKGRLAASQDAGRVFFIPYHLIDTFSYTNPVRESEVEELFGTLSFAQGEPAPTPPPAEEPPPARPSLLGIPSPARHSIRSEVLEKFRSSRPGSSLSLPRPGE